MKNDSILIVGSGALATFFAARLAASGQAVTMLGSWPEGLRALSDQGACLSYADDQPNTCFRVRVVDSPAACQGTHWALVFVKAWQTARAAAQLAACLASDGLALSLQNGLGNREILADTLGLARVAVGSTTLGARIISPGVVRPAGEGIITLPRNPKLNPLIHILKTADFLLEARVDLDAALWQKVAINAAINPLAALLECPNGALLAHPGSHALMLAAGCEAVAVARSLGFELDSEATCRLIEAVAARTKDNHASMLQDIRRGAQTEIEAICGAVCRAGAANGVPTPVNRTLWQLVQAKAAQSISQDSDAYENNN